MAEGKKPAIHKNGREVEPQNCRETPRVLPMMAYTERPSSPIWASEANRARTRERAAKQRGADDYF